jgi:hypothetical protein
MPPFVFPQQARAACKQTMCRLPLGDAIVAHSWRKEEGKKNYLMHKSSKTNDGQTQRILKLTPGVAISGLGGGALQETFGSIICDITKLGIDVCESRKCIERFRIGDVG